MSDEVGEDELAAAEAVDGASIEDRAPPSHDRAEPATQPAGEPLFGLLERLDLLDDVADLAAGGNTGLATGIEMFGESFTHDGSRLLDGFEATRDLVEGLGDVDDFL
jgi:hypothetical protein